MKQKLVYLLTVCLLMLAACGDEAELTGARTPDNTLVLKPGEQEVNIRLGGITASGTVPASRSNDAVSLPGESRIDELVVYCFVDIDRDGQVVTTPLLNNYTLERKYHYKANAAENDLVLTADGDSYRISILVPEDSHFRCFKIQVNMGDGSGATAVAVSEAIRSSATTAPGLPVSPLISADNDVITTPLPMSSDGYWEEELTGGYIQKNLRFSSGDLKKGMKASLVRQVSRFDINNPADTHFTVTSVTVSGVKPLPDNTTITDTKYSFTVSPANTAYIPAAFYVPAGNGESMSIAITGQLAGTATTVTIPCTGLSFTGNTRYVINITARGENLNGAIEIAPWKDADGEIDGELTGELNTEVHVSGLSCINRIEDNTIYVGRGFADFDFDITGAPGNSAPIEVIFPNDGNNWSSWDNSEADGTWKRTVNCENNSVLPDYSSRFGYFDMDRVCYYYPPYESNSITFVTQVVADGVKTYKYHEYKIVHQDYTLLFNEPILDLRPVVLKATGGWVINDEDKTITAPVFPGQGSIQLLGSEIAVQVQHSGKEAAMLGRIYADPRESRTEYHYVMRKDNFMSSEPRTFKLILYHRDELTMQQVSYTYDVVQPGGNGDVSLLSTGFTIDSGSSMINTRWGKRNMDTGEFTSDPACVEHAGNTLTIKTDASIEDWSDPPFVYNISIRSKDRNPVLVEIVQGSDWLYLDPFPCRVLDYEHYFMGLKTNNANQEVTQSAIVKVGYRDAQSGRLKTEYINVVREAGSDPW